MIRRAEPISGSARFLFPRLFLNLGGPLILTWGFWPISGPRRFEGLWFGVFIHSGHLVFGALSQGSADPLDSADAPDFADPTNLGLGGRDPFGVGTQPPVQE
jgi:hypothetical protein